MTKDITLPQMRAIYKLGAELGLDSEALHEAVFILTGSTSIKRLSSDEAARVITRLRDDAAYGVSPSAPRPEQASEAQKKKLWAMMFELFKYDSKPCLTRENRTVRLAGIVRRVLKREPFNEQYPLNGVTKPEIAKLIKAVERYIENEKRKRRCD